MMSWFYSHQFHYSLFISILHSFLSWAVLAAVSLLIPFVVLISSASSFHCFFGLPLLFFYVFLAFLISFTFQSSFILIRCLIHAKYHHHSINIIISICFIIGFFTISVFLTLSVIVTRITLLR